MEEMLKDIDERLGKIEKTLDQIEKTISALQSVYIMHLDSQIRMLNDQLTIPYAKAPRHP